MSARSEVGEIASLLLENRRREDDHEPVAASSTMHLLRSSEVCTSWSANVAMSFCPVDQTGGIAAAA